MTPARPSPPALFWRAVGRTTLAGARYGAVYGVVVLALISLVNGQLGQLPGAVLGAVPGLVIGILLGLIAGLALGSVLAGAWRRSFPEPAQARRLGLLAGWLVVVAGTLLILVLARMDPGGDEVYLLYLALLAVPAALMLRWLASEAEALARWGRSEPVRPAQEAAGVHPTREL